MLTADGVASDTWCLRHTEVPEVSCLQSTPWCHTHHDTSDNRCVCDGTIRVCIDTTAKWPLYDTTTAIGYTLQMIKLLWKNTSQYEKAFRIVRAVVTIL